MQRLVGRQRGADQRYPKRRQIVRHQAFDQPQAEMRAHAGAQDLGRPQASRALQRKHLADTKSRRAAQDAADIAGILQPVEHHRG